MALGERAAAGTAARAGSGQRSGRPHRQDQCGAARASSPSSTVAGGSGHSSAAVAARWCRPRHGPGPALDEPVGTHEQAGARLNPGGASPVHTQQRTGAAGEITDLVRFDQQRRRTSGAHPAQIQSRALGTFSSDARGPPTPRPRTP
jgi:hypothetical protein